MMASQSNRMAGKLFDYMGAGNPIYLGQFKVTLFVQYSRSQGIVALSNSKTIVRVLAYGSLLKQFSYF